MKKYTLRKKEESLPLPTWAENVFKQIHIDKYKATNLHISLDASGSMSGTKWRNTVMMTMAIAKAATLCSNLSVQVSLRHRFKGLSSYC